MRYRTPSDAPTDDMSGAWWEARTLGGVNFPRKSGIGCAGKGRLMNSHHSIPQQSTQPRRWRTYCCVRIHHADTCMECGFLARRMVREQMREKQLSTGVSGICDNWSTPWKNTKSTNLVLPADTHMKVTHSLVSEHDWLFRIYLGRGKYAWAALSWTRETQPLVSTVLLPIAMSVSTHWTETLGRIMPNLADIFSSSLKPRSPSVPHGPLRSQTTSLVIFAVMDRLLTPKGRLYCAKSVVIPSREHVSDALANVFEARTILTRMKRRRNLRIQRSDDMSSLLVLRRNIGVRFNVDCLHGPVTAVAQLARSII